jgi:hypothetical protein
MPAPLSMASAARARGDVQCLHTWKTEESAVGISVGAWQRTARELIDGYCFERR